VLRSVLLFTFLAFVALLIVGLGLVFVPELRVAVGLEQSKTLKPPPPTRVQPPPRAVTAAVPPGPKTEDPASDVSPTAPVVPPKAAVKAQDPGAPTVDPTQPPPDDGSDSLLVPDEPSAPAPTAKKSPPTRPGKRGASVRGSSRAISELDQQWLKTSTLFDTLENKHTCAAMGMECNQFKDLEEAVVRGGDEAALLRKVKKFHARLEQVQIKQGSK
ncbi:hypothetical protein D7V97_39460, partial [Corallococcus sp. CA053C]